MAGERQQHFGVHFTPQNTNHIGRTSVACTPTSEGLTVHHRPVSYPTDNVKPKAAGRREVAVYIKAKEGGAIQADTRRVEIEHLARAGRHQLC
jgi:hypothetical protein